MNTNGYGSVTDLRDSVLPALAEMARLIGKNGQQPVVLPSGQQVVPGLHMDSDATVLANLERDLRQGIFKVIVLGEFKNGKSTMLNSMLGNEILPAKATPATAIITMLVAGNDQRVRVYEVDKEEPRVLDSASFWKEFQLTLKDQETLDKKQTIDRFERVRYALVECEHQLVTNGVRLIDAPGLGESVSRTKVATGFLNQSQAVIFMLNATQILSQDEKKFIEKYFPPGRLNHVFFVVNKIDMVRRAKEAEEIKDYVRYYLTPRFLDEEGNFDEEFYRRRVFFINAQAALEARQARPVDEALLKASGVPALEQELERFLTGREKVFAALESTMQGLMYVVSRAQERIALAQTAFDVPLAKLEQRRNMVEKQLKELERNKGYLEGTIIRFGEVIAGKVFSNLQSYVNELRDTWPQDSREMIDLSDLSIGLILKTPFSDRAKTEVGAIFDREIRSYLDQKLREWSERLPVVLEQDVALMMDEIEAQVQEFELKLAEIGSLFATGEAKSVISGEMQQRKGTKAIQGLIGLALGDFSQSAESMLGKGDWTSFLGRMVQQILIGLVLGSIFSGGALLVALLIAEALVIARAGGHFKDRMLDKMGEDLFNEGFPKELPNQEQRIRDSVKSQFEQLATKLTAKLQEEIDEIRAELDNIIAQKQDQSFSAEQEKTRLSAIGAALQQLFEKVSHVAYGRTLTAEDISQLVGGRSELLAEQTI